MIKKLNLIFFLIIFFNYGCGYTPLYKNLGNSNFSINIKEFSGERKINNKINSILNNYKNNNSNNIFDISFNSKYKKNIIAKDSTGAATEYKIIIELEFIINSETQKYQLKYDESFNMQSFTDKLEEKDYEDSIQNNLTNIITRKLILQLSQLK